MRRLLPCLLALASPAAAAPLSQGALDAVGIAPPPGARLPGGVRFLDQSGRPMALAAAGRPMMLLFADYTCRHLCGPGVTLTAGALHDAGLVPGRDYALVVIGMDGDGPAKARAFAAERLAGLPAEAAAARLLSGTALAVATVERALGYHAVYDAASDQWAHDAASFVFARDGRLSRVLPETAVTPAMLRGAIAAAARGETVVEDSVAARLVAICYGFAAAHGVHGTAVIAALRIAGVATLAALALFLWRLTRRRRAAA